MEAKFKDVEFAKKAYTKIVKRIIDAGVRSDPLSPSLLGLWWSLAKPGTPSRVPPGHPTIHLASISSIIRNRDTLTDNSPIGTVDHYLLLLRDLASGSDQGAREDSTRLRYVHPKPSAPIRGVNLLCSGQRAFIGVGIIPCFSFVPW